MDCQHEKQSSSENSECGQVCWNLFVSPRVGQGRVLCSREKKKKKSSVTPAVLTVLMRRLIRLGQDKGQRAHVLEIDHNGRVTGGLNTNRAPTGCLLNRSASTNGPSIQ